jgi:hypothetical protein
VRSPRHVVQRTTTGTWQLPLRCFSSARRSDVERFIFMVAAPRNGRAASYHIGRGVGFLIVGGVAATAAGNASAETKPEQYQD